MGNDRCLDDQAITDKGSEIEERRDLPAETRDALAELKKMEIDSEKYRRYPSFAALAEDVLEGDSCADLSVDSPDYAAKRPPDVAFIDAGAAARDAFGHRYGSELLEFTDEMVEKLRSGRQMAIEINGGEYVLFVQHQ